MKELNKTGRSVASFGPGATSREERARALSPLRCTIAIAPASPSRLSQRLGGMRADRRRGLGAAERATAKGNPRIEITPSATQYRQLCRDLAKLRSQGAASNTAAILEAVHDAAGTPILRRVSVKGGPRAAPARQEDERDAG